MNGAPRFVWHILAQNQVDEAGLHQEFPILFQPGKTSLVIRHQLPQFVPEHPGMVPDLGVNQFMQDDIIHHCERSHNQAVGEAQSAE